MLRALRRFATRTRPGDGDKSELFVRGGARGVLCMHGFTGTPFEVRPLAQALAERGFTVLAPVLAGHGSSVEALTHTDWHDWLASATAAFDRLRAEVGRGPVAIAGFSMGGLLALRLAKLRSADVAALAVLAAPVRLLPPYQARLVQLLAGLPKPLRRGPLAVLPKVGGYDVLDPEMKRLNPALPGMPIAGIASLLALAEVVRRDLPDIRTPTLVVHGERDRTVPLDDSLELIGTIGAPVIERLFLPRSGHLVVLDIERSVLIEEVTRFFEKRLEAPAAVAQGAE